MTRSERQSPRVTSAVDRALGAFTARLAAHDPLWATLSMPGPGLALQSHIGDVSPSGVAEIHALYREAATKVQGISARDDDDAIAKDAVADRARAMEGLAATGLGPGSLHAAVFPLRHFLLALANMPLQSLEDVTAVVSRAEQAKPLVRGLRHSVRESAAQGTPISAEAIKETLAEVTRYGDPVSGVVTTTFASIRAACSLATDATRGRVEHASTLVREALVDFSVFLRNEMLPQAVTGAGCGREKYQAWSAHFLGTTIDIDDTYAWAIEAWRDALADVDRAAALVMPGSTTAEVHTVASRSHAMTVDDPSLFAEWRDAVIDQAVVMMGQVHFDTGVDTRTLSTIPRLVVAHWQDSSMVWPGPPDAWWPAVRRRVNAYGTLVDIFRECFPGRAYAEAYTTHHGAQDSTWRSSSACTIGGLDGWAAYAEETMSSVGALTEPLEEFYAAEAKARRALRAVADIGFHCGLPAPTECGGGSWSQPHIVDAFRLGGMHSEAVCQAETARIVRGPAAVSAGAIGAKMLSAWKGRRTTSDTGSPIREFHDAVLPTSQCGLDVTQAALARRFGQPYSSRGTNDSPA